MRTRKLFVAVFALLGIQTGTAQEEDSKPTGYISINGGFGLPLGDFGNENVGAASSGSCFNFNFSVPLVKKYFGLTTKVDFGAYQMSAEPFINQQRMIINSAGYIEGVDYTFSTTSYGSYTHFNLLTGLYTTLPRKRLSIDGRILIGFNSTKRPELQIGFNDTYDGYYATYYQKEAISVSFAYDLGFGLRYNLGKNQKLCVMLSFDYIGAMGNFDIITKGLYFNAGGIEDSKVQTVSESYSLSTYNTTLGIGYVFGNRKKNTD